MAAAAARLRVLSELVARLEQRVLRLQDISRGYVRARWLLVVLGVVASLLVERVLGTAVGLSVAGLCAVGFVILVTYHSRVKQSIARHQRWQQIKATHVARLRRDWKQLPPPDTSPVSPDHPFATDLNLIGHRSVQHLFDTTVSRGGSKRLRQWLLHSVPDPEHVRQRQALVRELVALPRFRDRLALYGMQTTMAGEARWQSDQIHTWVDSDTMHVVSLPWVLLLGVLAAANIMLYGLHLFAVVPALWPYTFVTYLGLSMLKARAVRELFANAYRIEQALRQLQAVLAYLETCAYSRVPLLAELCAPFWRSQPRPSVMVKRIVRIAGAASAQKANIFGVLLNALVPWDVYFAYRFAHCKAEVKAVLPVWLDRWYELEALSALASIGYLHPEYTFPEIQPETSVDQQPILQARALGHPLLPPTARVGNDVTFDRLGDVMIVTGSNMSGKSTFLRTLGVNMCLAFAGAPIDAAHCTTIPLRLFTCINVSDSVTDGISYFYAEVTRLKALLQALRQEEEYPLLFVIDEIFRGTNNRERLIGSRSYIRALAGGAGIGVISTHDLELVTLADEIPDITNYHFREEVRDGRMVFDYRLRPGPCPTTNALKIMALSGLPLPSEQGV